MPETQGSALRWVKGKVADWAFKGLLTAIWAPIAYFVYARVQRVNETFPRWPFVVFGIAATLLVAGFFGWRPVLRLYYRWRVSNWSGISKVYAVHPFGTPAATPRNLNQLAA